MSCGPGKGLEKLNEAQAKAQEELAALQGDIAGGIAGLKGKFEKVSGDIMGSLKEMMPTIELPEIPTLEITLPTLELPEIPQVDKLQDNIGDFINKINDPIALLRMGGLDGIEKEIQSIKDKFGAAVPNIDDIIADAKSGKIDIENLCKLVPNIEKAPDSEKTTEKGTPATAPEVDAEEVEEPVPPPVVKAEPPVETEEVKEELAARDPITAIDEFHIGGSTVTLSSGKQQQIGGTRWLIVSRKDDDGVIRTAASINGKVGPREPIDIKVDKTQSVSEPTKSKVLEVLAKHKAELGG